MDSIETWLRSNSFGNILRREPVGGGCINNTTRLHLESGKTLFLKENNDAPKDMFAAECEGLTALANKKSIRVPGIIQCSSTFLLLEDLGQRATDKKFWLELGEGLAQLHSKPEQQFGFGIDNYCGATPQKNEPSESGYHFFKSCRLLHLATVALHRNLLEQDDYNAIELIATNLQNWIPEQQPVLIHGDLWSGNIHCCADGTAALIDPACYWGWAEAELAMTELFGGFSSLFYESYESNSTVEKDWRERAPLYNLYHLLNHLVLFGQSYLGSIRSVTNRFA